MHNSENNTSVERRHRPRGKVAQDVVRQLNTRTGIIVDKYLVEVFKEQGFEFDPVVDNRSVYQPEKLFDALKFYERRSTSYDGECLAKAKRLAMREFGGDRSLDPAELSQGLKSFIKLDKSSGLPLASTKGAAFEQDLRLAVATLAEGKPFPACIAYHRVQFGTNGPKTRLVWGYPLSATLVEAMFARPLINHFLGVASPMAFGYRKIELSAVTQKLRNCGLTYCLDYSKFDSSLSAGLIHFAFDVLKSHFRELTDEEAVAWKRVVDYFIHTTILMPDGYIYQKHGGVPSGSYFTQLIDSIVNYVATQYIALRATGDLIPRGWVYVLGDDSIFTLNAFVKLDRLAAFGAELGLTINSDKSVVAFGSDKVHFLGHSWPHGVASRPLRDLILRLVTAERASSEPLPIQRGQKLVNFLGDSKEGGQLMSQVMKAQLNRWKYGRGLYVAAAPKESSAIDDTGRMRGLRATGIEMPNNRLMRRIGLWIT